MKRLLSQRADVNHQIAFGQHPGASPLHVAAQAGHKEVSKLLVANKATIDITDDGGPTPLMVAVINGQKEMVSLLLTGKANVDHVADDGITSLHITVADGNTGGLV